MIGSPKYSSPLHILFRLGIYTVLKKVMLDVLCSPSLSLNLQNPEQTLASVSVFKSAGA